MATVEVEIKYSNREFPRIYQAEGDDFATIKDAIKATGARFDGTTKRWKLNGKPALQSLQAQFTVKPHDFAFPIPFDYWQPRIVFVATGETVYFPQYRDAIYPEVKVQPKDEQLKALDTVLEQLQSWYAEGDEKFQAHMEAWNDMPTIKVEDGRRF